MNPGQFIAVMNTIDNLHVKQKLTVGTVNVQVVENCELEEITGKKVGQKLVVKLTRRKYPTTVSSSTIHIYPTEQKFMIQGSVHAKSMAEKEFLLPLIRSSLVGQTIKV